MNEYEIPNSIDKMQNWLTYHEFEFDGLYRLYECPKTCPWQFITNIDISQSIDIIFDLIKDHLPKTSKMLKERCKNIFALLYQNEWYLLYVIEIILEDDKISYKIIGGGQPTLTSQLQDETNNLGWTIPADLQLFYQVHNGFGDFDALWSWDAVLPDQRLTALSKYIDKDDVEGYDPKDLLAFFPDGLGNGQHFYRGQDSTLQTVDWDHETRKISNVEPFWDFVDRKLSKVDEDRYDSTGRLIVTDVG